MNFIPSILASLGGGAAVGAPMSILPAIAGGTAGVAGAVGIGSTVASILQGTGTALSVLFGMNAAGEQATSYELDAADAESEIATEDIQGLQRRNSLKKSLVDAVGEMDVANAASGIDLSFGSPVEARKAAVRDADSAITIDNATTMQRGARLAERAKLYRIKARSARGAGLGESLVKGISTAADIAYRG